MKQKIQILSIEDIIDFVYRSKLKGFAKTDKKTSLNDQSSIYSNRELPWCYTDHYRGNTVERGTEEVTYNLMSVWTMQYRGGYLEQFWDISEELGPALKFALRKMPKEFPARGPRELIFDDHDVSDLIIKGKFRYINEWVGDFARFTGKEVIFLNDEEIFYHDYMGGTNRDKYYPTVIK